MYVNMCVFACVYVAVYAVCLHVYLVTLSHPQSSPPARPAQPEGGGGTAGVSGPWEGLNEVPAGELVSCWPCHPPL